MRRGIEDICNMGTEMEELNKVIEVEQQASREERVDVLL